MKKLQTIAFIALSIGAAASQAQSAAAGAADRNKAERAFIKEDMRLQAYDKPVYKDPIGNALIGAPVNLAIRGAQAAVTSLVTGTAINATSNEAKKK